MVSCPKGKKVLRTIFVQMKEEVVGGTEIYVTRSFIVHHVSNRNITQLCIEIERRDRSQINTL